MDQARVIVRYVGVLAKELAAPLVARGEADMIGYCAQLDPVLLGVVGRRLAELVDPEGTQDRDGPTPSTAKPRRLRHAPPP